LLHLIQIANVVVFICDTMSNENHIQLAEKKGNKVTRFIYYSSRLYRS